MIEKILISPISELLKDLYKSSKGPIKQLALSCLSDELERRRLRYVNSIEYVKTIWQIDKAVSVNDFYYPTEIVIDKKPRVVENLKELFQFSNRVIIQGVAGQGKSIFLRYLASASYKSKNAIPIFIQFRHISKESDLQKLFSESLYELGIVDDNLILEHLMRKGRFVFFLDGFDELADEFRSNVIREIDKFSNLYCNVGIIISCRPNSDIEHSNSFEVYKINPLNNINRVKLINKLMYNDASVSNILDSLNNNQRISGVLTTPLLVTLLVITYKAENEIPEQLSDFYEALFQTLVKRHDRTKPGYIRSRRTSLGNIDLERIFQNISYLSLKHMKVSLTACEYYDFCESALRMRLLDTINPEDLMHDISNITCLIILDGDRYYYIHKSIPEFFAAQKISKLDLNSKITIYNKLANSDIPENWHQTIFFLSEVDEDFFAHHFLIPAFNRVFSIQGDAPSTMPRFTRESFLSAFGYDIEISISTVRDRYSTNLINLEKSWIASVFLANDIKNSFNYYINNVASDIDISLIEYELRRTVKLDDILTGISKWQPFLSFINNNSDLVRKYAEVHKRILKLRKIKSISDPLLEIVF